MRVMISYEQRAWLWLGAAAAWAAAFSLSCRIDLKELAPFPHFPMKPRRAGDTASIFRIPASAVALFAGAGTMAASDFFQRMADDYFHKGVGEHGRRAFAGDWYQRMREKIAPCTHVHIAGGEVREIMPWLWLAIKVYPHNPDVYLTAAFWLGKEVGRPDLALQILKEAQWALPFDYRIQFELGRLHLAARRLPQARTAFEAGLAFWPSDENPDSKAARFEKARMLLYRGLLREAENDISGAIADLSAILEMFPERVHIAQRIQELRSGGKPAVLASVLWGDMLTQDSYRRAACTRAGDGAHDHEAHQD